MTSSGGAHAVTAAAKVAEPKADIPALTGLRFLAALSVAVAHGTAITVQIQDPSPATAAVKFWLENGAGFGMSLFFVLSGFVIHYNYSGIVASHGVRGFAQFMWARFSRLYPLFLVVLVTDITFSSRLFGAVGLEPTVGLMQTVLALPYYLTFTQSWLYTSIGNSSLVYQIGITAPVMWSISTEWFFYLCYPVIMLATVRATRPGYAVGAALVWSLAWGGFAYDVSGYAVGLDDWAVRAFGAVAALTTAQGGINQDSFVRWMLYFSPYLRIGEFILGCLIAQAHMTLRGTAIRPGEAVFAQAALCLAIISIPVILFVMYEPGGTHWLRRLGYNFGLAPSIALLLFCAARYRPRALRLFETAALQRFGDASYAVYLLHVIVFAVVMKAMGSLGLGSMANPLFLFVRLVVVLALLVLLSVALFAYLEAPARRALRRLWTQPRGMIRPGTVALVPVLCAAGLVGLGHLIKFQEGHRIDASSRILVTVISRQD